ncbi:UPF0573 protein C2orf70 [Chanos chanos]|uniref:Ciliary microtubule inner protein 2C n=1 Tax=Chanos chanos TaxID=29144 RepID=A0A6J2V4T2_CHACN|nr:UPF0573 protein C2orf70 homolog [Chanos chanos]
MALSENGTQNSAGYIPASRMPGYSGHVPTIKFLYGQTFGNATLKYFHDFRCAAMASSTSPHSKGRIFPTTLPNDRTLETAQSPETRHLTSYTTQFHQTQRGSNRELTSPQQPVNAVVRELERSLQEPIGLDPAEASQSGGVRRYQTLPSGIRTSLDDRVMRDVFFERR